jgi:putative ABC transport system permease protein
MTMDVVAAWKGLRSGRWASLTAVLALAVGIGASVTAAALAWSALWRPLPFAQPEALMTLGQVYAPTGGVEGVKLRDFHEWRARLAGSAELIASATQRVTVRGAAGPIQTEAAYLAGRYLEVLGVQPEAGRLLTADDGADAAMISHRLAARLAGSSSAAVGQVLTARGRSLRVIGVLPVTMSVLDPDVDLWISAFRADALRILGDDDSRYYSMLARLQPARSPDMLLAEAARVQTDLSGGNQRGDWPKIRVPCSSPSSSRRRCCC